MAYIKNEQTIRALSEAQRAWEEMSEFRSKRLRYKMFAYGNQWSDITADAEGRVVTEGELARREGKKPMTNNLIRRLIKCIIGRFRMERAEREPDQQLELIYRLNNLDELDCRLLEEFLISGCAIQKITRERRIGGDGVWVDNVNPRNFFVNSVSDPRGHDMERIGMLHDMSLREAVMRFSRGDRGNALEIARIFKDEQPFGTGLYESGFFAGGRGKCRVAEVWTIESEERLVCHDPAAGTISYAPAARKNDIERENVYRRKNGIRPIKFRWELAASWRCRWLAPDGTLLDEYSSPMPDGGHPFVVKFYPLTDGEIHPLVEDVIDQQIHINRLITLIDQMISVSAKGTLLFPANQLLPGWTSEMVANAWSRPGAMIPYNPIGNAEPHQVSTNASNMGAHELLQLQMNMFEDVSGVNNALLGKTLPAANVGAERYESEMRNSMASVYDIIRTFEHLCEMRDDKAAAMVGLNGNIVSNCHD